MVDSSVKGVGDSVIDNVGVIVGERIVYMYLEWVCGVGVLGRSVYTGTAK